MAAKKKTARKRTRPAAAKKAVSKASYAAYTPLTYKKIKSQSEALAEHIESNFEALAHILLEYESYEVVVDEVSRTLDLLRSLDENKEYFKTRIGQVAAFLPRNQPLYAFACFVIIPSFMGSSVHFRIPHSMRHFFPKMLALLEVFERFPNIVVSHATRADFLRERTALRINPKTKESMPVTEAVIFTGTPVHADQLRFVFDQRTLFIGNGSGHNPVVVGKDANIDKAVDAVLTLQLYNQGQDCAAPNAVLVHNDVLPLFLHKLRDGIRAVGVGDYRDRTCRVGPISDPHDLVRIQDFLIDNRRWLDSTTPGVMRAQDATLQPTIIAKPLSEGGNFNEIFAPVIFLQTYMNDSDLKDYFEDPKYATNAMYVTLYGGSAYVKKLIGRKINGVVLHDRRSFLHNTHLHAAGNERGTEPYGGLGYGASSLSINGRLIAKATLPQRDIYEWVARPLERVKSLAGLRKKAAACTQISRKNIAKLLRMKSDANQTEEIGKETTTTYLDTRVITGGGRYVRLDKEHAYNLLAEPNADYIAQMQPYELAWIQGLRTLLENRDAMEFEAFKTKLYAIPVARGVSAGEKKEMQLRFFQHVYQLLFAARSGPRLAEFLSEIDSREISHLLDV